MAESTEDLNLPNAVVTRIIKEALPGGVNVGKDARLAISKAASVFVLYTTSCANNNALKGKRKTITVNDVFSALEDMEFDTFIEPLRTDLEAHKKAQADKKSKKAAKSVKPKVSVSTEEVESAVKGGGDMAEETEEAEEAEETGEAEETNEQGREDAGGMDTSS